MKRVLTFILIFSLFSNLSCSNILTGLANKESDEALYEDAQKLMDAQSWDSALAKMDLISSGFLAREDVLETWAGIYAGKCGLNFGEYFERLGSASLDDSTIMLYFMNAFTQRIIDPPSCYQAQLKIELISEDPAERSSGQNLFMAILGMVKVGTYLRNAADRDGTDNLGDGSADAGYSSCAAGDLSDSNLNQVISGMGLVTSNLATLSAVLAGGDIESALTAINTACGGSCGETDPDEVQAGDRDTFRDILRTGKDHVVPGLRLGIDNLCLAGVPTACC